MSNFCFSLSGYISDITSAEMIVGILSPFSNTKRK